MRLISISSENMNHVVHDHDQIEAILLPRVVDIIANATAGEQGRANPAGNTGISLFPSPKFGYNGGTPPAEEIVPPSILARRMMPYFRLPIAVVWPALI